MPLHEKRSVKFLDDRQQTPSKSIIRRTSHVAELKALSATNNRPQRSEIVSGPVTKVVIEDYLSEPGDEFFDENEMFDLSFEGAVF